MLSLVVTIQKRKKGNKYDSNGTHTANKRQYITKEKQKQRNKNKEKNTQKNTKNKQTKKQKKQAKETKNK